MQQATLSRTIKACAVTVELAQKRSQIEGALELIENAIREYRAGYDDTAGAEEIERLEMAEQIETGLEGESEEDREFREFREFKARQRANR